MAVIRLALVGCGYICKTHLNALKELNDPFIAITALVDVNKEAAEAIKRLLPAPQNCQIYGSIDEAGDDSYDAAIIMVPHYLHVKLAKECLSKGKHVLLEKPLATSIEGCKELLSLAQDTDKIFMVAESATHWPEVLHAMKLINEGVIGEPYYAQSNYWEAIGQDDFNQGAVPNWVYDSEKLGGGVVMAGGVHWIRPLRMILGEMDKVVGMKIYAWDKMKGETLAHALVQFKNGKKGALHFHYNDVPKEEIPYFQIFGPKGEITIHGRFDGGMTIYTKENVTSLNCGGYWGSFKPQMSSFLSIVKKGEKLAESHPGSVWQAMKDVLVAQALYRSAETGKWENVDI